MTAKVLKLDVVGSRPIERFASTSESILATVPNGAKFFIAYIDPETDCVSTFGSELNGTERDRLMMYAMRRWLVRDAMDPEAE